MNKWDLLCDVYGKIRMRINYDYNQIRGDKTKTFSGTYPMRMGISITTRRRIDELSCFANGFEKKIDSIVLWRIAFYALNFYAMGVFLLHLRACYKIGMYIKYCIKFENWIKNGRFHSLLFCYNVTNKQVCFRSVFWYFSLSTNRHSTPHGCE